MMGKRYLMNANDKGEERNRYEEVVITNEIQSIVFRE